MTPPVAAVRRPLNWAQTFFLAFLFGVLLLLPLIPGRTLESGDETRVAGIAAEMVLTGEWFVPHLNGAKFLEYPPLFYWCAGGLFKIFGITDGAARLTAMLFAIGSILLVVELAKKLRFSPQGALLAAIFLASGAQFFGNARKCTVDIALAFFVLLAITGFVSFCRSFSWPKKLLWLLTSAAGIAGGILTKGILGLGLPGVILGGSIVLSDCFVRRRISWKSYLALALAVFIGAGAASLYYLHFFVQNTPESRAVFHELFYVNNFGRFSGSQGDHVESIAYYFIKLPTLFAPYLPFVLAGLFFCFRRIRNRREMFLAAALLLPFLLFCAASSKRVVYLLPLAPFAALTGAYCCIYPLRQWLQKKRFLPAFQFLRAAMLTIALALVIVLGNTVLNLFVPDDSQAKLFARCRALEQDGYTIELGGGQERTRGGAVFYLRHLVPVVKVDTPQKENSARVVRSRREIPGAEAFDDSHWLIVKAPQK